MKNYIKLGKSPLSSWEHYVFLDTEDILAESLMNRHMVRRRIEGVYGMDNEEYRMVSVKVWKKDELRFLQSMEELRGKMLLFGHRDYDACAGEFAGKARDLLKGNAEAAGRAPAAAGVPAGAKALPEM